MATTPSSFSRPAQFAWAADGSGWERPLRGMLKLEDTLVVTEDGLEAYGDHGRSWNVAPAD